LLNLEGLQLYKQVAAHAQHGFPLSREVVFGNAEDDGLLANLSFW
jgi:hypothetical protein